MIVFGIGLPRSGTTSLTDALTTLGFEATKEPPDAAQGFGFPVTQGQAIIGGIPYHYEGLDRRHRTARFILTLRPLNDWLASVRWAYERRSAMGGSLYERLFGGHDFDADLFAAFYRQHLAGVVDFFQARPGQLLIHEPTDGWERLCRFLGQPIPHQGYPHRNRRR